MIDICLTNFNPTVVNKALNSIDISNPLISRIVTYNANGIPNAVRSPKLFLERISVLHKNLPKIYNGFLKTCNSKYCMFIDSSMAFYKQKINKQIERASQVENKYGVVGLVYHDLGRLTPYNDIHPVLTSPFHHNIVLQQNILTPGYLCNVEVLKSVGGFNETPEFNFDHEVLYKVSAKCLVAHIPEILMLV